MVPDYNFPEIVAHRRLIVDRTITASLVMDWCLDNNVPEEQILGLLGAGARMMIVMIFLFQSLHINPARLTAAVCDAMVLGKTPEDIAAIVVQIAREDWEIGGI